jgi:hypothetical protein
MKGRLSKPVILTALVAGTLPALADDNKFHVTAYEKAACIVDATRFCRQEFPDQERVLDCMKTNKSKLSSICLGALTAGLKRRNMAM